MNDNLGAARALERRFTQTAQEQHNITARYKDKLFRSRRLPLWNFRKRFANVRIANVIGSLPQNAHGVVTIISHELHAAGAPKALLEIVIALRLSGWAVVIVAPDDGPYAHIFAKAGALVLISYDALQSDSPAVELSRVSAAVICNTIACVNVVRSLPSSKVFWYLHETGAIHTFSKLHDDLTDLLSKVHQVWVTSQMARTIAQNFRSDIHVVPASSSPLEDVHEYRIDQLVNAVVVGSIESRKGQDLLVSALLLSNTQIQSSLKVRFIGRDLELDYAASLIESIKGNTQLEVTGKVGPEEALIAITQADLLIVPSRDEPLSLVAVEALSAGVVVICTKAAGISDYIEDGITGFVAPSPAPEDLAATIERAFASRDKWHEIGKSGRRLYQTTFSPPVLQSKVISLLSSCLNAYTHISEK